MCEPSLISRRAWLRQVSLTAGLATTTQLGLAAEPSGEHILPEQRESLSRFIRRVLIDSLPPTIEGKDDWGDQKEMFAGVGLKADPGPLKLEKKTKNVNHGLWKRYEIQLVDPERQLRFQIADAHTIGPRHIAFVIEAMSPLKVHVQLERWRLGVKLLNGTGDADATVKARIAGEVRYRFDSASSQTQLVLDPNVQNATLDLVEFDLRKVWQLEGPLVQEVGDLLTPPLSKLIHKQEESIVAKMNKELAKHPEKLQLALPRPFGLDWKRWLTG